MNDEQNDVFTIPRLFVLLIRDKPPIFLEMTEFEAYETGFSLCRETEELTKAAGPLQPSVSRDGILLPHPERQHALKIMYAP